MGRSPCCDEIGVKKGPWTPEEDKKLVDYIREHGHRSWRNLPKRAGLNRCGKSCRLRWSNYLRPDIKRGKFEEEEESLIIHLHSVLGNKWSAIATHLPGRTDNEIKNYWNTHLRKKLLLMGIDPVTHRRRTDLDILSSLPSLLAIASNLGNLTMNPNTWDPSNINALRLQADAAQLAKVQMMQCIIQLMASSSNSPTLNTINLLGNNTNASNQFGEAVLNGSLSLGSVTSTAQSNLEIFNNLHGYSRQNQNENNQMMINNNAYNANVSAANSTPSLVSASTEHAQDVSANSSASSAQFDGWEGLNTEDDFGWKDILDQISWPNDAS